MRGTQEQNSSDRPPCTPEGPLPKLKPAPAAAVPKMRSKAPKAPAPQTGCAARRTVILPPLSRLNRAQLENLAVQWEVDPRGKTVAQIRDGALQKHLSRPAMLTRSALATLALCAVQLASQCETAFFGLSKFGRSSIYKDIVMELSRAMDVVMTLADALEPWTPLRAPLNGQPSRVLGRNPTEAQCPCLKMRKLDSAEAD